MGLVTGRKNREEVGRISHHFDTWFAASDCQMCLAGALCSHHEDNVGGCSTHELDPTIPHIMAEFLHVQSFPKPELGSEPTIARGISRAGYSCRAIIIW